MSDEPGRYVQAVIEVVRGEQAREPVEPWASLAGGDLPSEARALLEALAGHAFYSLSVGDAVFREEDNTIELPAGNDDVVAIAQTEGGEIIAIPRSGVGDYSPVYLLAGGERQQVAESIDEFLEDFYLDGDERGLSSDITVADD